MLYFNFSYKNQLIFYTQDRMSFWYDGQDRGDDVDVMKVSFIVDLIL